MHLTLKNVAQGLVLQSASSQYSGALFNRYGDENRHWQLLFGRVEDASFPVDSQYWLEVVLTVPILCCQTVPP